MWYRRTATHRRHSACFQMFKRSNVSNVQRFKCSIFQMWKQRLHTLPKKAQMWKNVFEKGEGPFKPSNPYLDLCNGGSFYPPLLDVIAGRYAVVQVRQFRHLLVWTFTAFIRHHYYMSAWKMRVYDYRENVRCIALLPISGILHSYSNSCLICLDSYTLNQTPNIQTFKIQRFEIQTHLVDDPATSGGGGHVIKVRREKAAVLSQEVLGGPEFQRVKLS
jgi:hypothetical protein